MADQIRTDIKTAGGGVFSGGTYGVRTDGGRKRSLRRSR